MKKIIILASGRGSNAEAIYKKAPEYGYEISAIVCDNSQALVLTMAQSWKVPAIVVIKEKQETREVHEAKILLELKHYEFDLIVLAGYERILSPDFLSAFAPKTIINIHPSLLPKYPGLNSYEKAYSDKATKNGVTIHYVDQGMDTGEIISPV